MTDDLFEPGEEAHQRETVASMGFAGAADLASVFARLGRGDDARFSQNGSTLEGAADPGSNSTFDLEPTTEIAGSVNVESSSESTSCA